MKFSILASVIAGIALILEDYGTLQAENSVAQRSTAQEAELFKTYALELVNAAIPILEREKHLMEEGCECIPIYENVEETHLVEVFLATLSIAKDYREAIQVIENTTDFSEAKIDDGLMKNIRKILKGIDPSIHSSTGPLKSLIQIYLVSKCPRCSPGDVSASTEYKNSLDSAYKCYRFARSLDIEDNEKFFGKLGEGFGTVRELMFGGPENDPKSLRADLREIIDEIATLSLTTPDSDFAKGEFNELVELVRESVFDTDSDIDSDEE